MKKQKIIALAAAYSLGSLVVTAQNSSDYNNNNRTGNNAPRYNNSGQYNNTGSSADSSQAREHNTNYNSGNAAYQQGNDRSDNNGSWARRDRDVRNVERIGNLRDANKLIGMEVKDNQNERLGKIKDLLVDLQNGRVVEVIISRGGMLGVSQKFVAVPPSVLTFNADTNYLDLNVNKDQFVNSPEFQWSNWNDTGADNQMRDVYSRYGVQPYYGSWDQNRNMDRNTDQSRWDNNNNRSANWNNRSTNWNDSVNTNQVATWNNNGTPGVNMNASDTANDSNARAMDKRGQASRTYPAVNSNFPSDVTNAPLANYDADNNRDNRDNRDDMDNMHRHMHRDRFVTMGQLHSADKIIGSTVWNNQQEKLGKVDNMIIDLSNGRLVQVILSSGGFLGINSDLTAVPPQSLNWNGEKTALTLDTSKDSLKSAPHFKNGDWSSINDQNSIYQTYDRYHVQPYFGDYNTSGQNVRDYQGNQNNQGQRDYNNSQYNNNNNNPQYNNNTTQSPYNNNSQNDSQKGNRSSRPGSTDYTPTNP